MDPSMETLTDREVFVLRSRAKGWDNARIAQALGVSQPRVAQIAARATRERALARARLRRAAREQDALTQAEEALQGAYVWLVRARAMLACGDLER